MNHYFKKVATLISGLIILSASQCTLAAGHSAGHSTGHSQSKADTNQLAVSNGYVRATIPGTTISSAYMTIHNSSSSKKVLVAVSGEVSKRIELHEHTMANGMMKMRQVEHIVVAAKGKTVLKPSGLHLMIFNLTNGLNPGTEVTLTLHFASGEQEVVTLPVQKISMHGHHQH